MAWLGIGKVFSRPTSKYMFDNFRWVWVIILCYRVYCFLIKYLTWQLLIGGVNKPFSTSFKQNVFSLLNCNFLLFQNKAHSFGLEKRQKLD